MTEFEELKLAHEECSRQRFELLAEHKRVARERDNAISDMSKFDNECNRLTIERDELAAQVAGLMDAISKQLDPEWQCNSDHPALRKALSTTPPAALAALRAKHLEEAERQMDFVPITYGNDGINRIAAKNAIRALIIG